MNSLTAYYFKTGLYIYSVDVCDCEVSVCLRGCLSLRSVRPSGKNQQLVIGLKMNTWVFMILKSNMYVYSFVQRYNGGSGGIIQ